MTEACALQPIWDFLLAHLGADGIASPAFLLTAVVAFAVTAVNMTTHCNYRLPVYDWFFATARNHDVHHASREPKNISVMLSICDRAFGTFQRVPWRGRCASGSETGGTMRVLRIAHVVTVVVILTAASAWAAPKMDASFIVNPACAFGCPVDSVKKATLKLQGTDSIGANGLKGQLTISGALWGGNPVNRGSWTLHVSLGADGGACTSYSTAPFDIVDGKVKIAFTAADLGIAEASLGLVPCEPFYVFDPNPGTAPLIMGITPGSDAD